MNTRIITSLPIRSLNAAVADYFGPSSYLNVLPPTAAQLTKARLLFQPPTQVRVFQCSRFLHLPSSSVPEILLLGKSNVGKSTLLNILFNENGRIRWASTGKKPGKTKSLDGYAVGNNLVKRVLKEAGSGRSQDVIMKATDDPHMVGFVVVDSPGYGVCSLGSWGEEVTKYMDKREALKQAFVLITPGKGLSEEDIQLLEMLKRYRIAHQIVLTKLDRFLDHGRRIHLALSKQQQDMLEKEVSKVRDQIEKNGLGAMKDIICLSAEIKRASASSGSIGIDELRFACLKAAGTWM